MQEVAAELHSGRGIVGTGLAAAVQPGQQGQQQQQQQDVQQQQQQQGQQQGEGAPLYVLLVIDGTWKQAKEMFRAAAPYLLHPGGPGVRVQLPAPLLADRAAPAGEAAAAAQLEGPEAAEVTEATELAAAAAEGGGAAAWEPAAGDAEAPLLIRMEPMEGCLTTCEAGGWGCCWGLAGLAAGGSLHASQWPKACAALRGAAREVQPTAEGWLG